MPSPNYSIPKRQRNINTVIIHYTGMKSKAHALKRLTEESSNVSSHWLIDEGGLVYKLVEESNIAWHAGVSYWRGVNSINANSVGIEMVNKGHEYQYNAFPEEQMVSLEVLLEGIFKRYNINPFLVLGHSDIAPDRKKDPGELFDWKRLAKKKLAFWPDIKISHQDLEYKKLSEGDKNIEVYEIQKKLFEIGYKVNINGIFDQNTKLVVEAFQRRFSTTIINGEVCWKTYSRIIEVSDNLS